MKYLLSILFISFLVSANAKSLRVLIDSKQFYSPENGIYVEFYLQFLARGIHFQGDSVSGFKTSISTQIVILQDEKIVQFDKYKILKDFGSNDFVEDIYSLKRFSLAPGLYTVEYEFIDLNNTKDTIQFVQELEVDDYSKSAFFSDVLLIESMAKTSVQSSFSRNGFEMIPRLMSYYNVESERLITYVELYNTNAYGAEFPKFALRYYLRDGSNGKRLDDYSFTKVYNSALVVPIVVNMNIAELGTGSYTLCFELLDVDEHVMKKCEIVFDRFNPTFEDVATDFSQTIIDPRFFEALPNDSIFFFLESLTPISSRADVSQIFTLIDAKDLELSKKYFQSYWIRTNPKEPTDAWIKYKKSVLAVQKEYGTLLLPGYKSDRGRVFLQYGPPSSKIQRPNEPGEYPYEIWQYYKIGAFSNRRFVFYNPVGVGNEYVLLHSDLPGELFNNRWISELSRTGSSVRSRINDEGVLDGSRR